jgi:hypothetical protein
MQAEVKRLTALVEDAAKKNRQLIAIGSKLSPSQVFGVLLLFLLFLMVVFLL